PPARGNRRRSSNLPLGKYRPAELLRVNDSSDLHEVLMKRCALACKPPHPTDRFAFHILQFGLGRVAESTAHLSVCEEMGRWMMFLKCNWTGSRERAPHSSW